MCIWTHNRPAESEREEILLFLLLLLFASDREKRVSILFHYIFYDCLRAKWVVPFAYKIYIHMYIYLENSKREACI